MRYSDFQDRVKLLINYSLKKTLSENKSYLDEQGPLRGSIYSRVGDPEQIRQAGFEAEARKERRKEQELTDYRKQAEAAGCLSPERIVLPGVNKKGLSGMDAVVPEYPCTYAAPVSCYMKTGAEYARAIEERAFQTLYLPPGSRVWFRDDPTEWEDSIGEHIGEIDDPKRELEVIEKYLKMWPLGTVKMFEIASEAEYVRIDDETSFNKGLYIGNMITGAQCGGYPSEYELRFGWYFHKAGLKKDSSGNIVYQMDGYPQMEFADNRDWWDYGIDEYGTAIQWTVFGLTFLANVFCYGCATPLLLEIFTEATLGVAFAQRDLEKGDNISAAFNLLFAALPMFKATKIGGAVPAQQGFEVIADMRRAGLSSASKPAEIIQWYRRARPELQEAYSKMLRGQDEWSEVRLKKFFEDANDEMRAYIKANPDEIMRIPWIKKLHNRDITVSGILFILNLLGDIYLGQKLNDAELNRLESIHADIEKFDKDLADEFLYNLVKQPEKAKSIINDGPLNDLLTNQNVIGDRNVLTKSVNTKLSQSFGPGYENIPEDDTFEIPNEKIGQNKLDSLIKNQNLYSVDQVKQNNLWPSVGKVFRYNDMIYYQIKNQPNQQPK